MKTDTTPLAVDDIIRIHTDNCVRTAIVVAIAKKYTSMIWANGKKPGVKIHKIPHSEVRAEVIEYSLAKAKKSFRAMGRKYGIAKPAKRALRA